MNHKPKVTFTHSLKGRILLFLTLPTVAIIIAMVILIANSSLNSTRLQAEHSLQQAAQLVALEIEKRNANAIRTAKMMVLAQEEGLFANRNASSQLAHRVLSEFPEYTGAYFGYEPNINNNDHLYTGEQYANKTADKEGRFLPYWFRENGQLVVTPLVDMETSLYYDGVKKQFEQNGKPTALVTEPYEYQGKMIVEQTYPITQNSQFLGIAGVDRSLDNIENLLKTIKQQTQRDLYLVSRNGHFISATIEEENLQTQKISETAYNQLFTPLYNNKTQPTVLLDSDPISKENYFYSSHLVKTGEWLLILRESEEQVLAPIRSLFIQISIFASIGIIILASLSIWFAHGISSRVNKVVQTAEKIATGQSHSVEQSNQLKDEIYVMQMSLKNVSQSYEQIDTVCRAIAEGDYSAKMDKRSEQDSVAESLNFMSNKRKEIEQALVERSQQIEASTKTQSAEIENIATSMNEMSATINEVSSLAVASADNATEAVSGSKETQTLLSSTVEEIKALSHETSKVNDVISQVASSSENISRIVEVINMIAEQTNLLALNAAIEAARAGEKGRGFAVVADEVRGLASKTRSSTEEITDLIGKLQNEVESAVSQVEKSVTRTQATVEMSDKAYNALSSITTKVDSISNHMTQVATAVEEQSITCEEINKNITSVQEAASQLATFTTQNI